MKSQFFSSQKGLDVSPYMLGQKNKCGLLKSQFMLLGSKKWICRWYLYIHMYVYIYIYTYIYIPIYGEFLFPNCVALISTHPSAISSGTLQGRQRRPGEQRRGGSEDQQRTLRIAGRRWRLREDLRVLPVEVVWYQEHQRMDVAHFSTVSEGLYGVCFFSIFFGDCLGMFRVTIYSGAVS